MPHADLKQQRDLFYFIMYFVSPVGYKKKKKHEKEWRLGKSNLGELGIGG